MGRKLSAAKRFVRGGRHRVSERLALYRARKPYREEPKLGSRYNDAMAFRHHSLCCRRDREGGKAVVAMLLCPPCDSLFDLSAKLSPASVGTLAVKSVRSAEFPLVIDSLA